MIGPDLSLMGDIGIPAPWMMRLIWKPDMLDDHGLAISTLSDHSA
jgi:hypothetical protein